MTTMKPASLVRVGEAGRVIESRPKVGAGGRMRCVAFSCVVCLFIASLKTLCDVRCGLRGQGVWAIRFRSGSFLVDEKFLGPLEG